MYQCRQLAAVNTKTGKQTGERAGLMPHTSHQHILTFLNQARNTSSVLLLNPSGSIARRMNGCKKATAAMHGLECSTGNTSCRSISGSDIIMILVLLYVFFFLWMLDYWMERMAGVGGCVDLGLQPVLNSYSYTIIILFMTFIILIYSCIYIYPYIYNI